MSVWLNSEQRLSRGRFWSMLALRGQYYGTPTAPVLEALQAGRVVILESRSRAPFRSCGGSRTESVSTSGFRAEELQGRLGRPPEVFAASGQRLSKADGESVTRTIPDLSTFSGD